VSSNVSLLGAATEGHDYCRGCFLFALVCRGDPAWSLALDQLGVVGGNAVRDIRQGEVGQDSVEQELAEALSDFDLLTLAVVGECVSDDCSVVFVDIIVLGVGGGEDNGSMHGYLGADKGGDGYILVGDQGFINLVECGIGDGLTGDVVSFEVEGCFGGGGTWQVAPDFMFSLGVHGRNKLRCSRLPPLILLSQVLSSLDVGGMYGVFGWQVWLGGWHFGSVGIRAGAGTGVGGWVVDVVVVLGSSFPPFSFSLSLGWSWWCLGPQPAW